MTLPIIDITYFIRDINLPGSNTAELNGLLAIKEPEYLQKVLGDELFLLFTEATSEDGDRFYKLLNGAEYTNSEGKARKWKGFKNADKVSPIAYYTYYWYLRQLVSMVTSVGTVAAKTENSAKTNSVDKQVYSWGKMVELNLSLVDFINNSKDGSGSSLYPEFDYSNVDTSILTYLNPLF